MIDPEKGFHYGTLVSCIFGIFAQGVYSFFITSSLPFIIESYFPGIEKNDIGYYAGFFVSAYYLGQIPGCVIWGWFADSYGRRTAMITISILNVICLSVLTLTSNYYLALLFRLINGMVDGSLGTVKTIIAELSNERNISIGTGTIFIGTAFARFVGPLVGSSLSQSSVVQLLSRYLKFVKKLPFFLPFSVCMLLFFITLLFFVFFAEETVSKEEIANAKTVKREMRRDISMLLKRNSSRSFSTREQLLVQYNNNDGCLNLMNQHDIFYAVLTYGVHTLVQMGFDTLLPLVLVNSTSRGGFDMDSMEVSLLVVVASPMALSTLIICPLWSKSMKYTTQCIIVTAMIGVWMLLYPLQSCFNTSPPSIQYAVTIVFLCVYIILRTVVFNICIVLVANVCYKEFRGTVMGVSQTIAGVCRFIGPTLIPILYAWSAKVDSALINFRLSFFTLGAFVLLCLVLPWRLTDNANTTKGSVYITLQHKIELATQSSDVDDGVTI